MLFCGEINNSYWFLNTYEILFSVKSSKILAISRLRQSLQTATIKLFKSVPRGVFNLSLFSQHLG